MVDEERLALMTLHFVPGVGDFLIRQLIGYGGSATAISKMQKNRLLKIPGVGETTAHSIVTGQSRHLAEREFRMAEQYHTNILFFTDPAFPQRLSRIEDAPSLLYVKGNINLNTGKTVALVGTRQATTYGKAMVEQLIEGLKPHAPLIISGLAYGVDVHAHKTAVKLGLATVGVLGSSIDIIYPAAHKDLAKRMTSHGGLISEHPFGTPPDAHNFPARNRIIAGLADALIVVEAATTGGALITANIANTYNRDVFAVPGNVGQAYSEGCNQLIKTNRANLITCAKDLEYIMNWQHQPSGAGGSQLSLELPQLDHYEQRIVSALKEKKSPTPIDELSLRTGLESGKLASHLLNLEFRNLVVSLPGKCYQLAGPKSNQIR
ncbi:MAG TPA: DNA-processing protein DprA [Cyclobacteriaceae bacterium]|nr:DNA-processing protein DprA [Cyclobacteriaceae bacterium]